MPPSASIYTTPSWECDITTGDLSWVLFSTAMVLGMLPGLAFFEAGLLRAKNTVSILAQIFSGIAVLSTMWFLFGYSLSYSDHDFHGIVGDFSNVLLLNLSPSECTSHALHIPSLLFCVFQMMFAIISPLLMTGSFAERLKFTHFLFVIVTWEIFVHYLLAHWVWSADGWLNKLGVLDYAGGLVLHVSAGVSSLVFAIVLGRRRDFKSHHGEAPPSNLAVTALGACFLLVGWIGFNAGSALRAGSVTVSAVLNTLMAAAASGVVWTFFAWFHHRKPSFVAILNGLIAGLAGITPASGYVSIQASFAIGIVLGVGSYLSVVLFKHVLKVDDCLDVTSIHGVTGMIGSFAIGIAATKEVNEDASDGWINGNPKLMAIQLLGIVVCLAWSALVTFIIAIVLKKWMRADARTEEIGMDSEFLEARAYEYLSTNPDDVYTHTAGGVIVQEDDHSEDYHHDGDMMHDDVDHRVVHYSSNERSHLIQS